MKKPKSTLISILITFICLIFIGSHVFFNSSVSTRHLINLIKQPRDLYKPILIEPFFFDIKGFQKNYILYPKYFDFYEFGIIASEKGIPSEYEFSGKIKIEYFSGNKMVREEYVSKIKTKYFLSGDLKFTKSIVLTTFPILLKKPR